VRLCPSCATAIPPDHEFCGKCGTALNGARGAATETVHQPRNPTPSSPRNMDEGRYPPGTLLLQRYRVVSLLGRGGMGEVYRANDLLLGQTVALKFLPAEWTSHEETLARFRTKFASPSRSRIQMSAADTTSAKPRAQPIYPWNTWTARIWLRCCVASAGCRRTRRWKSRVACQWLREALRHPHWLPESHLRQGAPYVAEPFAGCMLPSGIATGSLGMTIQATKYAIAPNSGSGQTVNASQTTRTSVTSTPK
jgi:hypothetical protein